MFVTNSVFNHFSAGMVFRRQNLTSIDVRFWRINSITMITVLKELKIYNDHRPKGRITWSGTFSQLVFFVLFVVFNDFRGSLRDREVACSASDRQGSNFESCVWRTVSSQSSHHPQEVLLAQFSLYVHKGGLKPDSFYFIDFRRRIWCLLIMDIEP